MGSNRREFLRVLGAGALGAAFPASILKALAIPARRRTGTLADVEHVVILMQENRSFDHYFGTLRGVRGFGDPRAVTLGDGGPVWAQPAAGGRVLPFHPGAPSLGLQFVEDLAHDWTSTQAAWNEGRYDGWVRHKGPVTMAHLERADIPFHFALADAFTVCDAYHCSLLGPTDPNRYHMWTGWVGNDGRGGGPVVDDAEAGYAWTTYPERLQAAGISWKIYQDIGTGLGPETNWGEGRNPYIGNYGDNSLLYFEQFQHAVPGSALYERACRGSQAMAGSQLFAPFLRDARAGRLPQVSWIVAPEAYCEHPNWPANYGAWFVAQILDALTANPEVWSRTVLFVTYDENDGFFDHVVPPTPPADDSLEVFPGSGRYPRGPYGLGVRVPMFVISPWSTGGWVSSEVFDHTSLLRFLERRFGVRAENITPWRRAVCGDLTATLDLAAPQAGVSPLPSTLAYQPPDRQRHVSYKPVPPAVARMPVQEPGQRPARPVPYELHAEARPEAGRIRLRLRNPGRAAAVLQVRSPVHAPRGYTLAALSELSDWWNATAGEYQLSVYGPNGFFRMFSGQLASASPAMPELRLIYDPTQQAIRLEMVGHYGHDSGLRIFDSYARQTTAIQVPAGTIWHRVWPLDATQGWYDLEVTSAAAASFRRRFAGHLETGSPSMSDPALGRNAP